MSKRKRCPWMCIDDDSPFMMLFYDLLNSAAWRWLKPSARDIYINLRTLYYPLSGRDNTVKCSYTWINKRTDIRINSIRKYIYMLELSGLVEISMVGGRNSATEYRFSAAWKEITEKDYPRLDAELDQFKRSH